MENKTLQPRIFERNTEQINSTIAKILAHCSGIVAVLALLSFVGFFQFGRTYTYIFLAAGLFVCLMPQILIRKLPENFMKYYMLISVSVFIGLIGTNLHIGIYIIYILVPILSCLYFDPTLVLQASGFSYVMMLGSLFAVSVNLPEYILHGHTRLEMFFAYSAGFTAEYVIASICLYYLVKIAKRITLEHAGTERLLTDTETERQMLDALCVNFTVAYCCDLLNDRIEPIKQQDFTHYAIEKHKLKKRSCYSEWMRFSYDTFIVKESAADYPEVFDAKNLMRRLQTEESFVYRLHTLPNGAGMEYFETTVVRLYSDENSFNVIIGYHPIDDIVAEEKKNRKKLEQALSEAERANMAKTDFLRRMSHDIRTPLNGIIGLLKINESHYYDAALIRENHSKIMVSANHLLSLINDVLQMSKLESGEIELAHEYIDLAELTADIVNIIIDRATEAGISWEYERDKSEIPCRYVYGSSVHLRQIFLNIYGNCIKYNRKGGKITTIVDMIEKSDSRCRYRWTIADTGLGMSEEYLAHIFEPFTQEHNDARSSYHGTGLGMSIVKKLIDRMGGTIEVTSREGEGSTFVITLPFEIAEERGGAEKAEDSDAVSIYGLHLLVAEDNELNAEIAQTLLEDEGARVTVAADGEQAAEMFENSPDGTFDAILMDIMMPKMDGYAAAKAIRASGKADAESVPIIAMTANAFAEDAQRSLAEGMNGHIAKPIDVNVVKEKIRAAMKSRNRKRKI